MTEAVENNPDILQKKYRHLSVQVSDSDIAIVNLDGPGKENVLDEEIAEELHQVMNAVDSDKRIIGVVIGSTKADSFVAGADIRMLEKADANKAIQLSRLCQKEYRQIEQFRCPVLAAVMGNCMGGGLELILSCTYRICMDTDTTVFAAPEVKLGLLPAGGGTQRLPKKIFLPKALDMLITGRTITAKTAYKIGLVEQLLNPIQNEDGEVNYADSLELLRKTAVVAVRHIALKLLDAKSWYSSWINVENYFASTWLVWNYIIKAAFFREIERVGVQNMPAPHSIIKAVEAALFCTSEIGYKVESEEFGYLIETKESKALIGLFHGITKCKKQRFGEPTNIKSIAIIGTSDAALACACKIASKEFAVTVIANNKDARRIALEYISKHFDYLTKKEEKFGYIMAIKENIRIVTDEAAISCADFILIGLESNADDTEYERALQYVENLVNEKVTILVHLFGRSINSIVKFAKHPNRILGVCYGLPYKNTKYAELIKHNVTDDQAIANAAFILWKQKTYILLTADKEETPGYYLVQCILSLLQTVCEELLNGTIKTAQDMDTLTRKAGFIGEIAKLCDVIGLDAIYKICQRYTVKANTTKLLEQLILNDRTGIKQRKGFHLYSNGGGKTNNDSVFDYCVQKTQQSMTSSSYKWNAEPTAKMLVNVVDTALRCFENGVITDPDDGDVGCVFGIGFPPAYGGPFRYVTQRKNDIIPLVEGNTYLCHLFQTQLANESEIFYCEKSANSGYQYE